MEMADIEQLWDKLVKICSHEPDPLSLLVKVKDTCRQWLEDNPSHDTSLVSMVGAEYAHLAIARAYAAKEGHQCALSTTR
jgi:hypothetical protein